MDDRLSKGGRREKERRTERNSLNADGLLSNQYLALWWQTARDATCRINNYKGVRHQPSSSVTQV